MSKEPKLIYTVDGLSYYINDVPVTREEYFIEQKRQNLLRITKQIDIGMMIETVLGYLEMGKIKKAIKHLEVANHLLKGTE